MKRCLIVLTLMLLWALPQWATSAVLTTNGSSCPNSTNTTALVVNLPEDKGGATLTVTGTWTGTISFYGSGSGSPNNGGIWTALNVTPLGSSTAVTSTTANGTWQVNVAGFTGVCMLSSASMTGSATVTVTPSAASARSNGGGGGGSPAFNTITSGTNTTAAMVLGSGSSLTVSGTGTNNATALNGTAFAGTTNDVVLFGASNTPLDSLGGAPTLSRAGLTFTPEPAPTAPTAALVNDGGGHNCTAGAHTFAVMYVTANGRTNYGAASGSVTCDATHTEVALTAIPTGTAVVTGRDICATKAGGTVYYIVSAEPTIADNSTTTYTFNVADATLGTGVYVACPIGDNSTAGVVASQWGVHTPFGSVIIGNEAGQIEFPIDAANVWTGGYPAWPYNTFVGTRAGRNNTPSTSAACATSFKQGTWNTLIGGDAGLGLVTGCLNVVVGGDSDHDNDIGAANTFVGVDAGQSAGAGINYDTSIGERSGANDTSGSNTFVGANAGQSNTSGSAVTMVGFSAGQNQTTAIGTTAVGYGTCGGALATTGGDGNTCVGNDAGNTITGTSGTFVGMYAGKVVTSGIQNTFIGEASGQSVIGGGGNVAVGQQSLLTDTSGNYNTHMGFYTGVTTNSLTGTICIGAYCSATASHQAVLGGTNANGYIDHLYLGEGVTFTAPQTHMYVLATSAITTSNQAATELDLGGGASTGTGQPQEACMMGTLIGTTGATVQTQVKRFCTGGYKALTSGSAVTVLSIPLATLQTTGGSVNYTIRAQDGTNNCSLTGSINWAGENSAATFKVSPSAAAGANELVNCTGASTLTDTWTLTSANPALMQITATTSLTATTMDLTYSFYNNGMTDPTVY